MRIEIRGARIVDPASKRDKEGSIFVADGKIAALDKAPDGFKIESFVIRVGEWGGHMLLDCDDPLAVHKFCSTLPAFTFEARCSAHGGGHRSA